MYYTAKFRFKGFKQFYHKSSNLYRTIQRLTFVYTVNRDPRIRGDDSEGARG